MSSQNLTCSGMRTPQVRMSQRNAALSLSLSLLCKGVVTWTPLAADVHRQPKNDFKMVDFAIPFRQHELFYRLHGGRNLEGTRGRARGERARVDQRLPRAVLT